MHALTAAACAAVVALPFAGHIASHGIGAGRPSCTEIAEADVAILPHGFLLVTVDEFVPQEEVAPSSDGRFWRCATGAEHYSLRVPLHTY
jgi:hypothetical protein